ncbi:MAG: ComEC/Rec2 family competence protein [Nitrospinota bacterium]
MSVLRCPVSVGGLGTRSAFLVGQRVAQTRSTIMILVVFTARMRRMTRYGSYALCLAILLIMVGGPQAMDDVIFQLSFISVAAVIISFRATMPLSKGSPGIRPRPWRRPLRSVWCGLEWGSSVKGAESGPSPTWGNVLNDFTIKRNNSPEKWVREHNFAPTPINASGSHKPS